jgi:hypothetical protein
MAQFLVLAYDGTDAGAGERRRAARPGHFEGIKPMVAKGEIVHGGEPYVKERVWQKIEVKPVRVAVANGKISQ